MNSELGIRNQEPAGGSGMGPQPGIAGERPLAHDGASPRPSGRELLGIRNDPHTPPKEGAEEQGGKGARAQRGRGDVDDDCDGQPPL
jgi:hypothetical protein